MSVREEVDRCLAANDMGPEGIRAALQVLADTVDRLSRPQDEAERLQRLAQEGFEQGGGQG